LEGVVVKIADSQASNRFAEAIQAKMDELGLDINQVAGKTESTYEHVRKLVRGMSFPSKYYLRVLCDILDLEIDDMERLLVADRIQHKYGKIPLELSGKNPSLDPVERLWEKLTKKQQQDFIAQMQAVVKRNRAEAS
jgi:transcriptional regulator with XRE-family HTH domain